MRYPINFLLQAQNIAELIQHPPRRFW